MYFEQNWIFWFQTSGHFSYVHTLNCGGASHIFTLAPAEGLSRPSAWRLSGPLTLCVFECVSKLNVCHMNIILEKLRNLTFIGIEWSFSKSHTCTEWYYRITKYVHNCFGPDMIFFVDMGHFWILVHSWLFPVAQWETRNIGLFLAPALFHRRGAIDLAIWLTDSQSHSLKKLMRFFSL